MSEQLILLLVFKVELKCEHTLMPISLMRVKSGSLLPFELDIQRYWHQSGILIFRLYEIMYIQILNVHYFIQSGLQVGGKSEFDVDY